MTFSREIIVTDRFEALHFWEQAPSKVGFLQHPHRHIFKVRLGISVIASDREREFFLEKRRLRGVLADLFETRSGEMSVVPYSCESMAEKILETILYAVWCEVWEDGENGCRVTRIS
jgi:hypothetical protein